MPYGPSQATQLQVAMSHEKHAPREPDPAAAERIHADMDRALADVTRALEAAQTHPRELDPSEDQAAALTLLKEAAIIIAGIVPTTDS